MAQLIRRGERTWQIRVFRGRDAAGKRRFVNRTVKGSKRDAQLLAHRIETEVSTGDYREPSRQSFGDYASKWLLGHSSQVRPRTLASYRWLLEKYVLPVLGEMQLSRVTLADVEALYGKMRENLGLSARTVRYTHSVLRRAFVDAVRARLCAVNPTEHAKLPRAERKETRFLSPDEARRFLAAAESDKWHALWSLLLMGGVRPSEALGLKWSDVESDRVRIRRALVRRPAGEWQLANTKTSRSRRAIPLPESTMSALKRHRIQQVEEKIRAGSTYVDHGLVFAGSLGNPPDPACLVRNHFNRILKRAEIPQLRLYDLRHSSASLLLAQGVHPKVVSERLGHSSIATTLDIYSHVIPGLQEQTAVTLERLLIEPARSSDSAAVGLA